MVRGRFAPSPTGHLTVGNARTALLAWLDVKSRGGEFVMRLDDTDPERESVTPAELVAPLPKLGITWDEGFDVGGPYQPYATSARVDRHREVAQRLVEEGHAYWDYTPPIADAAALKKDKTAARKVHRGSATPVEGVDPVLRLKLPSRELRAVDRIFGEVAMHGDDLSEPALLRGDRTPTYHLASCVDDADMGVTSIVRGADWLNYTPIHAYLFEVLGAPLPEFAHVPLLLGVDGSKLSKRHGDLSLRHLLDEVGMPGAALASYLAHLGRPDVVEWESLEDMLDGFDIADTKAASPTFDPKKLRSVCKRYVGEVAPEEELRERLREHRPDADPSLVPGLRTRATSWTEMAELLVFLDEPDAPRRDPEALPDAAVERLLAADPWTPEALAERVDQLAPADDPNRKDTLLALRRSLTEAKVSPPLEYLLLALGRDRAAARLAARAT